MSTGPSIATSDSQSVNPLYDFNQSDFTLGNQKQPSANPLYDFMSTGNTNGDTADLLGTGPNMETSPMTEDDNLLSSIDAKLKEKATEDQSSTNLMNGEGDLMNGNGAHEDQTEVQTGADKGDEEVETIEMLEEKEMAEMQQSASTNEDLLVDTGAPLVDTGDQLVETDDQLVDTTDQLIDTSDQLVDTGAPLVDTGDQVVDTSEQLVDTSEQLVETDDKADIVEVQTDNLIDTEDNLVATDAQQQETQQQAQLLVDTEEIPQNEGNIIVEDDDLVEKNINDDFDASMMKGSPAMQPQEEQQEMVVDAQSLSAPVEPEDYSSGSPSEEVTQEDAPAQEEQPIAEEEKPVEQEPEVVQDEPEVVADEPAREPVAEPEPEVQQEELVVQVEETQEEEVGTIYIRSLVNN